MQAASVLLSFLPLTAQAVDPLQAQFNHPPASARPWVYWFWNNGNVTEEGIRADLAAMKEVGIGGAIMMDVLERFAPPPGDADYMSPKWQALMKLALTEARNLGIELNVTNGPGWCGSSGPWITPETSMQALVSATLEVTGPRQFSDELPLPSIPEVSRDAFTSSIAAKPFYRDIAVLAYPKQGGSVPPGQVLDLTNHVSASGKLVYPFPEGRWVIQRFGHASTGSSTRPPVKGGNGLECDKFSGEVVTDHFNRIIGMLAAAVPPSKSGGLVATHVDSWEVGSQSWTKNFAAEFKTRRGYELTKYLPDIATHTAIGSPAEGDRFRWDFYQTCSDLLAEKYIGTLADLSHKRGLRFTMEGYNLPFGDEADYTALADEPMTEFWSTGGMEDARKAHEMASVGHVMGRAVIGAEAFTATEADQWTLHPALVKAMGDYQMAQGVNRFVIHRYAMQPYLDRFPGATMGPWGLHYERTQTWWKMSTRWHDYLSRCQFMLRQGHYVADALYLRHQYPNQTYFDQNPPLPAGYRSDDISARQLIERAEVNNGRIVLPDGMSYRLLVLPNTPMVPDLVRKIGKLVREGAVVYGPRPMTSPSLENYPSCDQVVADLSGQVWGDCNGSTVKEHAFGQGKVLNGIPLTELLAEMAGGPDLVADTGLNWIHRRVGDREIYFIANPRGVPVLAACDLRIKGMVPHRWNPETGETRPLGRVDSSGDRTRLKLRLEAGESCFIVCTPEKSPRDFITEVTRDGKPIGEKSPVPVISITRASYGPAGDAGRTIDAKSLIQGLIDAGTMEIPVTRVAQPKDPAYGVVKTLHIEATVDGKARNWSGIDGDRVVLLRSEDFQAPEATVWGTENPGTFVLATRVGGEFRLKTASGKETTVTVPAMPEPLAIRGPWTVSFPPKWGAPPHITMQALATLSESEVEGVRHFSGVCTYQTSFDHQALTNVGSGKPRYWLDLGTLEVMGSVKLNGVLIGTVWNRPARIEVSSALKSGRNELVIDVANLWPNRMIGDTKLPAADRLTWSSYQPFNPNSTLPKSGLIGPVQLGVLQETEVNF